MRVRSRGDRARGANKRTEREQRIEEEERESSTNNHRPPPLIVSERKLNIDQSKQCDTMDKGETEQGYK